MFKIPEVDSPGLPSTGLYTKPWGDSQISICLGINYLHYLFSKCNLLLPARYLNFVIFGLPNTD